jgi:hypothetical protein
MTDNITSVSLLITDKDAAEIIGREKLDKAIASGKLTPIRLNDRPGAPSQAKSRDAGGGRSRRSLHARDRPDDAGV